MLGLRVGAPYTEIKASYRRLARLYHPDVNSGNQETRDKFIALTEAYKYLLTVVKPEAVEPPIASTQPPQPQERPGDNPPPSSTKVKVTRKEPTVQFNPQLSAVEQKLKQDNYTQLQRLLREQKLARAVALIEGLAQRIPNDVEIRQWQAIVYHRFGSYMLNQRQFDKARAYLKKALRTDPRNRSLWAEVEKEFRRMEQMM